MRTYAYDDPGKSAPQLPVTESNPVVGQDPKLANPSQGDYAIPLSSPAAKKGLAVAGVVGDRTGACYGNPPSIGAYEAK